MEPQGRGEGRFRLDIRRRFFAERGWSGSGKGSPAKQSWHSAWQSLRSVWTVLKHRHWILDGSVGGQDLNSVILMGSFQLRIFCDSRKGKGKGEKDGKRREGMGKVAPSCFLLLLPSSFLTASPYGCCSPLAGLSGQMSAEKLQWRKTDVGWELWRL